MSNSIDYGPLTGLVGVWKGDKGTDIAPDPNGTETNPYHETITFSAIGDVKNAGSQVLAVLHYRQIVQLKSTDDVFHDETGYWMWDSKAATVIHSLTIPRAVSLLAGGSYAGEKDSDGNVIIEVSAAVDDKDWKIIQSPFMRDNASTTKFTHKIVVGNNKMSYFETMMIDIYGKTVEHTDENELVRQ